MVEGLMKKKQKSFTLEPLFEFVVDRFKVPTRFETLVKFSPYEDDQTALVLWAE